MLQRITIFFTLSFLYSFALFAQSGSIKGTLKDAATQEGVIGANVVIEGTTTGASTDVNGFFNLPKVEPGTYTLVISYISYKTKKIEGVRVEANKVTTVNAALEEEASVLQDIVVTGTRATNTEIAVISEIKAAQQVVSGISAEQISRSLDRDAAQVVRRVPGITLVDDRFVVVRGLSSRYNTVMLNGVLAPSTEFDNRAFSFDIIPSSLLDKLLIFKSGSAEIPGEFAGAVVKVYTKNVVDNNFTTFNITGGYRNNTTLQEFKKPEGSSTDFLGFDDGKRQLPAGFPDDLRSLGFNRRAILAESRKFENNWQVNTGTASPDLRMRFDLGRSFFIKNAKASTIFSASYSNTNQYNEVNRFRYTGYNAQRESVPFFRYTDEQYSNSTRIGLLSNWSLTLNPNNKIEFRNLYTRQGIVETIIRSGINDNRNLEELNYSMRYQGRSIFTSQLQGTHDFSDKSTFTWVAGVSKSDRNEPDWKRVQSRKIIGSEQGFEIIVPNNATAQDAARFYTNLDELSLTTSGEFEHKFGKTDESDGLQIKAGYFLENKNRDFAARTIGYVQSSNGLNPAILAQPLETIFSRENIGLGDSLLIGENTKFTDIYSASNTLVAGYGSASFPFLTKFNLSTGARVEYNRQQLETAPSPSGRPLRVNNPITSVLPFANLTYNFNSQMLMRAAYSKTINRPEFRELAPFSFYDFEFTWDRVGNPNLKIADIQNIDLRWEYYPTPAEVVSVGLFYKDFRNPIETTITTGADNPIFVYNNAAGAVAYGAEIEIRKSLATVTSIPFINNLNLVFNGSIIRSEIDLGSQITLTEARTRPLQGQSPYVINTGVYYQDPESRWQVNLMYNVYGPRIFSVGDNEFPTIFEMPRNLIDLSVARRFGEKIEVRFGVADLLNSKVLLREDGNLDGKINNSLVDKPISQTKNGQYGTLGFTYKF